MGEPAKSPVSDVCSRLERHVWLCDCEVSRLKFYGKEVGLVWRLFCII